MGRFLSQLVTSEAKREDEFDRNQIQKYAVTRFPSKRRPLVSIGKREKTKKREKRSENRKEILRGLSTSSISTASSSTISSTTSSAAGTAAACFVDQIYVDQDEIDSRERVVGFATVDIHEFEPTLGDNPSCTCGPPLALSDYRVRHETLDVDDYEHRRAVDELENTNPESMMICPKQRRAMLSKYHSTIQVRRAESEVKRSQRERNETVQQIFRRERAKRIMGIVFVYGFFVR